MMLCKASRCRMFLVLAHACTVSLFLSCTWLSALTGVLMMLPGCNPTMIHEDVICLAIGHSRKDIEAINAYTCYVLPEKRGDRVCTQCLRLELVRNKHVH